MANNRMLIACTDPDCETKNFVAVAKHWMDHESSGAVWESTSNLPRRLNEFFDQHRNCGDSDSHFKITYENASDSETSISEKL